MSRSGDSRDNSPKSDRLLDQIKEIVNTLKKEREYQ